MLLDTAEKHALPGYLVPLENELGTYVDGLIVESVAEPYGREQQVVRRLLCTPGTSIPTKVPKVYDGRY